MIRKGYADSPPGQIHYRRVDGPGDPIVLLHRTPVDSSSFDAMLKRMEGRRAAIALDTPGFGQSFRPQGLPSARDYAGWFAAALSDLGVERFHLCAHHTGTHFATELAVLAPERVRSLLLNGVLYAGADDRAAIRQMIGDAPPVDAEGGYLMATWSLMKSLFSDFDAELVHVETLGALNAAKGRDQAFGAILGQDFEGLLPRVSCPVRIVQAIDDPLTAMLGRVRTAHPEIEISLIGAAGLAGPERQPRQFAASALRFAADFDDLSQPFPKSDPMTDRRFVMFKSGPRFDLKPVSADRPSPGPGEVLMHVRAVSINRRDIMILKGQGYPVGDADQFLPLSDAAGEIAAVGAGVTSVAVGDKVCSTFFQNWRDGRITGAVLGSALGSGGRGVLADHVVLSEYGVTPAPAGWSFEEAATLPCAAVTAWSSLVVHGQLRSDDWVLVMGTGGVALFGLQIALAAGAKVAVISSSAEKLEKAKALGATVGVNYAEQPDWAPAVREATGGGVHQVLELGGAGTLGKSLASLAVGGRVALVGALDGFGGDISAAGLIMGVQRVTGVSVGSRADQLDLIAFLEKHGVKPRIDSVYDVESMLDAYDRADAGAFGKVVVRLD